MNSDLKRLVAQNSSIVEEELKLYLENKQDNGLAEVMGYSLLSGGKRIRPFLVLETYRLFSKSDDITNALPFACALEMIHTYSLIHDDLPCMDNDSVRRGRPTNHIVYSEAEALLAGDTLLTYAFEVLAYNKNVSDKSIRLATCALAQCAGFSGMAGGQMIDIKSGNNIDTFDKLINMHSLKTGALIKCAMLLGYYAFCDTPDEQVLEDLTEFAIKLGIAFQIRDDILDKISNTDSLGKPVGSDEKNGKVTSLTFMSVDEAQKLVDELTNDAIEAIESYYCDVEIKSLIELAKYMVGRNY